MPTLAPQIPRPFPWPTLVLLVMLCLLLASATGCASYTDRIRHAQIAVTQGEPDRALEIINDALDVDTPAQLPADLDDTRVLLLLERAALLQAKGEYRLAARDLIAVDDRLEWLDIKNGDASEILRYIYSDDAGDYRAPPHERLLLNILNLINFLAAGELAPARVEARRFDLLQTYYLDHDVRSLLPAILGLGNYLAGAAFEASKDYHQAARFYTRAKLHGIWPEANDNRLLDLIALTGYTGAGLGEFRAMAQPLIDAAKDRPRLDRQIYRDTYQQGDALIVVQTGLSPYRRTERINLASALAYSARSPYESRYLEISTRNQALSLYHSGVFSWLSVPMPTRQGLPPRRQVRLHLPQQTLQLSGPVSIAEQVDQGWQLVNATVIAAAISRATIRHIAGESTRLAASAAAQYHDAPAAGLLGWLLSLALQGTMAAVDTPDTRSWTSLPADIHLVRLQLPPGSQTIDIEIGPHIDTRLLDVDPHRFLLINASRYR